MNLAKLSTNGQITVPAEIRRLLRLGPGDKVLFIQNSNGEVVIAKAEQASITVAQQPTGGTALEPDTAKDPIQALIEELRNGTSSS